MKKIILILIIFLLSLVFVSCKSDNENGENNNNRDPIVDHDSDPPVDPIDYKITGVDTLNIGESTILTITNLQENDNVRWISDDETIATVSDGTVSALKEGTVTIKAIINDEIITFNLTVLKGEEAPKKPIKLSCKTELTAGEIIKIDTIFKDEVFDIEWTTSNAKVAIIQNGTVLALSPGTTIIKATNVNDTKVFDRVTLTVKKYESEPFSEEDIAFAQNIMKDMTIDEMIGQMVIGSNASTTATSLVQNSIINKKLGNFIFMGSNTPSGVEAGALAAELQNLFMENLGIPAFISIDQETGRICRLTNGGTRFLGNMASAAMGDAHDRYLIGEAVGEELKTYGINFDLAPVLDVNNNPSNPVINNRSFSDNPLTVSLYGVEMMNGLKASGVMSCAKHFPGHGDTATDSHYGLPVINYGMDRLYRVELAPFICAIYNGIDAIMTTHILFTALDSEYPATLSNKVLTGLLRGDLGFNGLIITDGMEMQGITNGYGDQEAAVLAVQAGADILCYTTINGAVTAIDAIKAAYNEGKITKERIEESVLRILIKKKKYNLFNDYLPKEGYANYKTTEHEALNLELAKKAVTVYKGDFSGLDKTKKTIILSSKCSYQLKDYTGNNNSFGYYAKVYLNQNGMNDVTFQYISSIKANEVDSVVNTALKYDQIVVAISDANSAQIKLVNELAKSRSDLIVVSN